MAQKMVCPCPFCDHLSPKIQSSTRGYQIICFACKARGPRKESQIGACRAWEGLSGLARRVTEGNALISLYATPEGLQAAGLDYKKAFGRWPIGTPAEYFTGGYLRKEKASEGPSISPRSRSTNEDLDCRDEEDS